MKTHTVRVGLPPRAWQEECWRKRRRFSVLALHRRAGKTEWALMLLIDEALQASANGSRLYVYVAPFLKQAKAIAWTRLKQLVGGLVNVGAASVNESELLVEFPNGSRIRLYGADNPDALRGVRLDGVVVDEVAQIKPAVWVDILQPALSDRLGWAAFIGTPSGINLFSELFFAASGKADWMAARYTVADTGAIDPGEAARLEAEMPPNSWAREYLCDFAAAGDDQLISLVDVDMAARRTLVDCDVAHAPVILGVDPARFGGDRSCIVRRQGLAMFEPIIRQGIDNMELAELVAAQIEQHKPDAVFIDSGAGAGVIDRLRQLGHNVFEVPFGGTALHPKEFANRRTEMWCGMAEWLRAGGAIPNHVHLKTELATPIYWFDAQHRKMLESKDDMKKRLKGGNDGEGGKSPDIADALALTFAAPVHKANPLQDLARQRRREDYNPFAPIKRRR